VKSLDYFFQLQKITVKINYKSNYKESIFLIRLEFDIKVVSWTCHQNQNEGWKKFKNGAPARIDATSFKLLTWPKAELPRFFTISKKNT